MKEFRSRRLRVWENINRTMQEFKVLLLGYRSYSALLTQNGTDAPVATVLENTLGGTPVWSYDTPGLYFLNLSEAFTTNKTFALIQNTSMSINTDYSLDNSSSEDNIAIITFNNGIAEDGLLVNTPIEIRVYN